MTPSLDRGWRKFAGIATAAVFTHVTIGTVATLRGDAVAWGSLVRAPLIIAGLVLLALATRRVGYMLLTSWFAVLALMYAYGTYNASDTLLSVLRFSAAVFFAWAAVRLATSLLGRLAHERFSSG